MARTTLQTLIILLTTLFAFSNIASASNDDQYYKALNPKHLGLPAEGKLTHIHFYFHDIITGENTTVLRIAGPKELEQNSTNFGFLAMVDDPLTVGPDRSSKKIGSAQGMYGFASQTELALVEVLNYVFTEGRLKGSTVSLVARNPILLDPRELPIVGGTGVFRFARGFAELKTHSFNLTSGNAVVEYNMYVYHY